MAALPGEKSDHCLRHRENFGAFTGPRRDFSLILLILNMIIPKSFIGPTHFLSANVWGPVSFMVYAVWQLSDRYFLHFQGFLFASAIGHSPTKYLYVRTRWCKQDKMSWIKKCLIFPIISKLVQKLLYNSISPVISHSVIYILGGPIASFIPQVYNYVRKYVYLVQHHTYSLAINTSFDLLLLCSNNVATD